MTEGWTHLLRVCSNHYGIPITIENRQLFAEKLVSGYLTAKKWKKSWPLKQLEAKALNARKWRLQYPFSASFKDYIESPFKPTIDDCLHALGEKTSTIEEAHQLMLKVCVMAEPAWIPLPDARLCYKAPVFEPYYNRNAQMVDVIFSHIRELDIPPSRDIILAELSFYHELYSCFFNDFWPSYLVNEFKDARLNEDLLYETFSRLLTYT